MGRVMADGVKRPGAQGVNDVAKGEITADRMSWLAERLGMRFVDLSAMEIDPDVARLSNRSEALHYDSLPVALEPDGRLVLATCDPSNIIAFDHFAMETGHPVDVVVATQADVRAAIERLYAA
jgi:type IV pilus assembly protein PilB